MNGYRAITKDEGAVVEAGDQFRNIKNDWKLMPVSCIADFYDYFAFGGDYKYEYRRPIAQDEPQSYSSDTKPVVDKLRENNYKTAHDACVSNQPELPDSSQSEWEPEIGKECKLKYFKLSGQSYSEYVECMVEAVAFNGDFIVEDYEERLLHRIPKHNISECLKPIQPEQTERDKFALSAVKASEKYSFGENLTAEDARQLYDWLSAEGMLTNKDGGNE